MQLAGLNRHHSEQKGCPYSRLPFLMPVQKTYLAPSFPVQTPFPHSPHPPLSFAGGFSLSLAQHFHAQVSSHLRDSSMQPSPDQSSCSFPPRPVMALEICSSSARGHLSQQLTECVLWTLIQSHLHLPPPLLSRPPPCPQQTKTSGVLLPSEHCLSYS